MSITYKWCAIELCSIIYLRILSNSKDNNYFHSKDMFLLDFEMKALRLSDYFIAIKNKKPPPVP